jgi:hypothetical protein
VPRAKATGRFPESTGGCLTVQLFVDGLPAGAASLRKAFALGKRRLAEKARRLGADGVRDCSFEFWVVAPPRPAQRAPRAVEIIVRGTPVRTGAVTAAAASSVPVQTAGGRS